MCLKPYFPVKPVHVVYFSEKTNYSQQTSHSELILYLLVFPFSLWHSLRKELNSNSLKYTFNKILKIRIEICTSICWINETVQQHNSGMNYSMLMFIRMKWQKKRQYQDNKYIMSFRHYWHLLHSRNNKKGNVGQILCLPFISTMLWLECLLKTHIGI